MEIWVMSQDKYKIVGCNLIHYDRLDETKHVLKCDSYCREDINLGTYSTREKAIKVLVMIKKHIEESGSATLQTNEDEWLHYNSDVFQMPQDDEVQQ